LSIIFKVVSSGIPKVVTDSYMTLRAFKRIPESPLLSGKKKEIDTMTMSKPFTKVAFAVLLALILIVAIYTSVQGAWLNAGTRVGQAHVDAGLHANLSHSRSSVQLSSSETQLDAYKQDGGGHGCESEAYNSSDY
jgi:hypothetical protein